MLPRVQVQERPTTAERCALCRDRLNAGGEAMRCRTCHTGFHRACSRELGGCPTLGCADAGDAQEERTWLEAFEPRPGTYRLEPEVAEGSTVAGALAELRAKFSFLWFLGVGGLAFILLAWQLHDVWGLPHAWEGAAALALAIGVDAGFHRSQTFAWLFGAARQRRPGRRPTWPL